MYLLLVILAVRDVNQIETKMKTKANIMIKVTNKKHLWGYFVVLI